MRTFVAAFVSLILMATGVAGEPTRRVSVTDLIANPTSYFDQRLTVTGVVHLGTWGPNLCAPPSEAKEKEPECTDLDGLNLPFGVYDWHYHRAVIEVVGYFSHSCYQRKQVQPDGSVIEVICMDRGGNGWLTEESVRVVGAAADCTDEICSRDKDEKITEIELASPEAVGIDALARRLVDASRSGRVERMLDLLLPSQRTEVAWFLERDHASAREWVGRLASVPGSILQAGAGYRLIRVDDKPPYEQLCFCTTADCSRSWQYAGRTATALRRFPIQCFYVWRGPKGWVLLY